MRFRGLPADLKLGCIDVRLTDKTSLPLLPCGFCKSFHIEYFMCDMGHVTCRECGTEELNKVHSDTVDSACFSCGKRRPLRRVLVSLDKLRQEKLRCPCSFEGSLSDIQKHFREGKNQDSCLLKDRKPQDFELDHFKRELRDLDEVRDRIESVESYVLVMFYSSVLKQAGKLDDLPVMWDYTARVEAELGKTEDVLAEVDASHRELQPAIELLFRNDCFLAIEFGDVASSEPFVHRAVIGGIPIEVMIQQDLFGSEIYIGFLIRGCLSGEPNSQERRDAYPLEARVVVRLHNPQGCVVSEGKFRTFTRNGEYTSLSFKDPETVDAKWVGVEKFISVRDLKEEFAIDGRLIFSLQFKPIRLTSDD